MACTPEEIERKRKIALEKLSAKKPRISSPISSPVSNPNNRVLQHKNSSNFSPKAVSSFNNHNAKPYDRPAIQVNQFFGKTVTANLTMINENRFEANLDGYCAPAIEIFKTIPSKMYSTQSKIWNFDIDDYELLLTKLSELQLQPNLVINKIPSYVINLCKKPKLDYSNVDLSQIEPELLNILMPFQKEGVYFGIKNNGRCLIADDMGLGKTFQALAIVSYYKFDWPLLIITTSSMRNTWEGAIHKYFPNVPLHCTKYMVKSKDFINDVDILIVSHDMMSRSVQKLLDRKFGVVIVDESHVIKNFKAKCTKSAIELAKVAKRVILLSGTPALSRPSELYSQLSLIDEHFFGGFYEFSKRYCDGKTTHFGWDATGKSNLTELEIILSKRFMIRRTKEVLIQLPGKTREVIRLDVGLNQLSEMDQNRLKLLVDNYTSQKARDKHSALLSLFSESARIKIPSVRLYIDQILKDNNKFLVFAHHQIMLDALCKVLNDNNKKFIRIDGNTTSDRRKYYIDQFQQNESCIAAVLSITAANAGITLTAAQLVLFAELHWNPSILSQAESRAHRIGQSGHVLVRYLLGTGTVDDHIWPLLQSKQDILSEVGLCKDSFKDTSVTDQVIESSSEITRCNTKQITDYFFKEESTVTDNSIEEFMAEDDDFFVNADIDF